MCKLLASILSTANRGWGRERERERERQRERDRERDREREKQKKLKPSLATSSTNYNFQRVYRSPTFKKRIKYRVNGKRNFFTAHLCNLCNW
jgi:hypothetical protein